MENIKQLNEALEQLDAIMNDVAAMETKVDTRLDDTCRDAYNALYQAKINLMNVWSVNFDKARGAA
jgi:hypothetical protein